MPIGLLTGLGAALAWGTMDIASALASRVIGSLRVTAGVQVVGATILIVVAILTSTAIPSDPAALAYSALLGLIGAGAYFAYFTGLRVGPIAVVSGMVAAYGGLTVVLSVVLRGETLTTLQASRSGGRHRRRHPDRRRLRWRLAEHPVRRSRRRSSRSSRSILFAMMAITTDVAIEYADWLQVLLVSRIVNATLGIVAGRRRRPRGCAPPAARGGRHERAVAHGTRRPIPVGRVLAAIVLAGTLDVIGLASFGYGLANAPTWLVGLASSFGPAVTILIAVAFLGERLKPIQWFGLSGVAVGMIAIAIP